MEASYKCDQCNKNILGLRWRCTVCENFDLCGTCQKSNTANNSGFGDHKIEHAMKPFRGSEPEEELHSNVVDISTLAELKQAAQDPKYKLMVCNFFANWYKPSQHFFPLFSKMSLYYPEARFVRVDIDVAKDVTAKYNVSFPSLKIFQKGKPPIDFSGVNVLANPTELESIIGYELGFIKTYCICLIHIKLGPVLRKLTNLFIPNQLKQILKPL